MADGNLYGSSRDVGKITSRLPQLTKGGGRVNRVGSPPGAGRLNRQLRMFFEFTEDSFRYDSESEFYGDLPRELVSGATSSPTRCCRTT